MSSSIEPRPRRAPPTVLVIAADVAIESLVGELIAFAGYRPAYDVTTGAAGESVRRVRPAAALLDISLPHGVVDACLAAAHEVPSKAILTSSSASAMELAEEARTLGYPFFALPGGPKPLSAILAHALLEKPPPAVTAVPARRRDWPGSVHPSLCAAMANVARARALSLRAHSAVDANRGLREARRDALVATRGSHAALRAAVTDLAHQLKGASVPFGEGLAIVQDAVAQCAAVMGADAAVPALMLDCETWSRAAYVG